MMGRMTIQLALIDTQPSWKLDERTRQIGRRGLAQARAALRAGLRDRAPGPPDDRADGQSDVAADAPQRQAA